MKRLTAVPLCTVVAALVLVSALAAAPIAQVRTSPGAVDFSPLIDARSFVLTVATPEGKVVRREFAAGEAITFSISDSREQFSDGAYTWELTAAPRLQPGQRAKLDAARASGDLTAIGDAQRAAGIPDGGWVQSGSFRVADGAVADSAGSEPKTGLRNLTDDVKSIHAVDQVIPDDLIVQGSECVGLDCVNNENFGFDTIRLKENNTRIHFDDTSTSAGFPANDWTLIANDSASGGSSKFSIEDRTGAKVPFTITAGAATNSIFADSTGRIGLRTSTPVLDLHISTSNTPAIRLEQTSAGGFTAQTWDIAGNEANFFVRDVTGGSRLPLRIRPGAPTSSIDISADGDVGIGTASPSNKLHVLSSGSGTFDGKVLIQNTSGTTAGREQLELNNKGSALFVMNDISVANSRWVMGSAATSFLWDNQADVAVEMTLDTNGNLTTTGTVNGVSSRAAKMDFVALDPKTALSRVAALPISIWSYKADGPGVRHLGPMSEDFYQAFGLGQDDKHISFTDSAGVALAAVQGLNQVVQEKDQQIADLKSRIEALETMVRALAQGTAASQH